jgi:hypothetical protein
MTDETQEKKLSLEELLDFVNEQTTLPLELRPNLPKKIFCHKSSGYTGRNGLYMRPQRLSNWLRK